jgi:hypothetical protein
MIEKRIIRHCVFFVTLNLDVNNQEVESMEIKIYSVNDDEDQVGFVLYEYRRKINAEDGSII